MSENGSTVAQYSLDFAHRDVTFCCELNSESMNMTVNVLELDQSEINAVSGGAPNPKDPQTIWKKGWWWAPPESTVKTEPEPEIYNQPYDQPNGSPREYYRYDLP
jgi:hypothetical protein